MTGVQTCALPISEAAGTAQARQPAVEVEGGERRRLLQQQVRGRQRVHRPRRRRRRKAETGPKQQHGKPENRRAAVHAGEATAKALPDRQAGGTGLGDGTPTIFNTSLASSRPSDRREREDRKSTRLNSSH